MTVNDFFTSWPFGVEVFYIAKWNNDGKKQRIQRIGQQLEEEENGEWKPSNFSGEIQFYVGMGITVHAFFEDGKMVKHHYHD